MDVEKERVEDGSGRRNRRMGREVMIACCCRSRDYGGVGLAISLLAERPPNMCSQSQSSTCNAVMRQEGSPNILVQPTNPLLYILLQDCRCRHLRLFLCSTTLIIVDDSILENTHHGRHTSPHFRPE
jgi:hypothetical protein